MAQSVIFPTFAFLAITFTTQHMKFDQRATPNIVLGFKPHKNGILKLMSQETLSFMKMFFHTKT